MAKKKKNAAEYITDRPVAENRKARFNYSIEDTLEAGISLLGTEVKSLRVGRCNLTDSYAAIKNGRLVLMNMHIGEWEGGNRFNHEPMRVRNLLLHKLEIRRLLGLLKEKGITLVPLKIYFNKRGYAKVLLGIAKGKQLHDKRQTIKERDWKREQSRLSKYAD